MKTFSKQPGTMENMEVVDCPICSSRLVRELWDCGEFVFSSCEGCGHVYQNPRPAAGDLIERYDGEYLSYEVDNDERFFALMKLGLKDVRFSRIEADIKTRSSGTPRFLDIGCATGMLVRHFKDRGWDAQGVEVCTPAAEYGKTHRGVTIHIGTLETQAFPDQYFDVVHSSHVIEHVPEPGEYIAEQARIVKSQGYLIVTTPNRSSLQARWRGKNWRSAIADHVHLFSRRHLGALLKRHGFRVVRWKTWGGAPVGTASGLKKKILDRGAKVFGFGDVMIYLAQKR
ncbi:class I SAM-dependent methyltransferase [Spirochaeta lutea]|uniref:Methyltransferase type 11 n=1 Tax=Spirochaeta lutea TaxID=1480694 RepID=A0A098R0M1_9SPIO|nr:class I SAM-dependent methyltransferase [Spirochaeta lutea]KGE73504.1 hypothetical protein DC28_02215 [Spirochaeta lutea]